MFLLSFPGILYHGLMDYAEGTLRQRNPSIKAMVEYIRGQVKDKSVGNGLCHLGELLFFFTVPGRQRWQVGCYDKYLLAQCFF